MVELRIFGETDAWHNFAKTCLVDGNRAFTFGDVNEVLKEYNGRIVDYLTQTVTFDTEQDKAFFMLKWA